LAREADTSSEDILDEMYCYLVYYFQKELGITLDENYPVARFTIFVDQAIKESKKLKEKSEHGNNE
jgi:hypothetical protein